MESGEGADSGSRYAASVEINRDMKLGTKKALLALGHLERGRIFPGPAFAFVADTAGMAGAGTAAGLWQAGVGDDVIFLL